MVNGADVDMVEVNLPCQNADTAAVVFSVQKVYLTLIVSSSPYVSRRLALFAPDPVIGTTTVSEDSKARSLTSSA